MAELTRKNYSEVQGYGMVMGAKGNIDESPLQISERLWFGLSQLEERKYTSGGASKELTEEELGKLKKLCVTWRMNESYKCVPKTHQHYDIIDKNSLKNKK